LTATTDDENVSPDVGREGFAPLYSASDAPTATGPDQRLSEKLATGDAKDQTCRLGHVARLPRAAAAGQRLIGRPRSHGLEGRPRTVPATSKVSLLSRPQVLSPQHVLPGPAVGAPCCGMRSHGRAEPIVLG
jgi:hypothetical protein